MLQLNEPQWWFDMVKNLNEVMNSSDLLSTIIPITADIFVFLFPILLIVLYCIWLIKKNKSIKESALWIFRCAIITTIINVCVQFFFDKDRPLVTLLWEEKIETVLHKYLPDSSFPSDHSAMSMWFAMWLLLRGIKKKNKTYIRIWIIFLIFSLIMWFSRIMVWAHRPTDVLWWFTIWILVPVLMNLPSVFKIIQKILINPIIRLQEWIRKLFGAKN